MVVRRLLFLAVALGLFAGNAAAQEEARKGQLNAMSFQPVPTGKAVSVRPLDDSEQNLALAEELTLLLKAGGYSVADDAPLVVTFEVREQGGAFSDSGRRTILELQASGGGLGGQEQSARLNIFDSARGGMLNEGDGGTRVVTPDVLRIDMTVDEKGNQRLWHGWATAENRFADTEAVTHAMLDAMVRNLGQRVRQGTFALP